MAKTYVLSLGGSLVVTKEGIAVKFLRQFRNFIIKQVKKGDKFYIVVGGGLTARTYVKAALETTRITTAGRDWVGISATRLNAQLVKAIFGPLACEETVINPLKKIKTAKKIVIAAGYKPGWSTDYVSVLIAKHNNSRTVINLSNIDYAYDRDPKKFPQAKKLVNVSWPEFRKVVGNIWKPGSNLPFDPVASREAAKNKMKVLIVNGRNLKNLENCLSGQKFQGTTIA